MAVPEESLNPFIMMYVGWQNEFAEKGAPESFQTQLAEVIQEFRAAAEEAADMEELMGLIEEKGLNAKAANIYSQAYMSMNQAQTEQTQAPTEAQDGEDQVARAFAMHIETIKKDKREASEDPERAYEIPFYDRMIELYDSGISYPKYLKAWEEEGFAERMAAHVAGQTRSIYEDGLAQAEKMIDLPNQEMFTELLEAYDAHVAQTNFGAINGMVWEGIQYAIQKKHWPRIREFNMRITMWTALLNLVDDWVDSLTKYAPYDYRWEYRPDIEEAKRRVKWVINCVPGIARAKEAHYRELFGIGWDEIFSEPSFEVERKRRDQGVGGLIYPDDRLEFFREAWPEMVPGKPAPDWLVKRAEESYEKKKERTSIMQDFDKNFDKVMEGVSQEQKEQHKERMENIRRSKAGPGSKREKGMPTTLQKIIKNY